MKDEKIGITCEEALKAFSDLGEALRKEMVTIKIDDDLSELKPLGIKVTDKDGKVYMGEPDWKILNVNCLPDGWSKKGTYEFSCNVESGKWIKDFNKPTDVIIAIIENNAIYRYRPTPTKKTHEELDNKQKEVLSKMVENIFNKTIDDINSINPDEVLAKIKEKEKSHEELAEEYAVSIIEKLRISHKFNIDALFQHIHFAFIAGRKSMEEEK